MRWLSLLTVFTPLLNETFSFPIKLFLEIYLCFYILQLIKLHPFSFDFCSMKDSSIPKDSLQYCMVHPINVILKSLQLYKLSRNHHCKRRRDIIPYFYLEWIWYLQQICFTECCELRSTHFFRFMISQLF